MRSRSRQRHQSSKMPELNLVPMLDVLMTVLTFFIIISMILTAEKGVNVALTGGKNQPPPDPNDPLPDALVVEIDAQEKILVNKQPFNKALLNAEVKAYLEKYPKGAVLLQADRNLAYEKVVNLLDDLQAVGRDRVSLALDDLSGGATESPSTGAAANSPATSTDAGSAAPSTGQAGQQPAQESTTPTQEAAPGVEIPKTPEDYDS